MRERHFMPGEGIIDWGQFLRLLDEIGYAGPLMSEATMGGETIRARLDLTVASFREHLGWRPPAP